MKNIIALSFAILSLLMVGTTANGQSSDHAVLFNMTGRNQETDDSQLYSARHMLEIAGIPFIETDQFNEVINGALILFSSPVIDQSFSAEELATLTNWVNDGGVIISPACKKESFSSLFGYGTYIQAKNRYTLIWIDTPLPEFEYFDEPEEKAISLGRSTYSSVIKSYGYTLSDGLSIAVFDSGETAVIKKKTGSGITYLFGVEWRDVIQRGQLNRDFEAQRIYSNGFEPSADVFPLFLRSVWKTINPVMVWKFTIPRGYTTALIPTHDVDARTSYDTMWHMSAYEKSMNFSCHYFMTTRYFKDDYLSASYNSKSVLNIKNVMADGHTIGNHSVGHFPDMDNDDNFPIGEPGLDTSTYKPFYDSSLEKTLNGSTYGEIEVSKNLLTNDLGTPVISFRSGHLLTNESMNTVLEATGHLYNSSFPACDVLTAFPYFEREGYTWSGTLGNVLEIPMMLSDVFSADPISQTNYPEKVAIWKEVVRCQANNYAPNVILIHPTRKWKTDAEKMLIDNLNLSSCGILNFEDYGRFWRQRFDFNFNQTYNPIDSILIISSTSGALTNDSLVCLMIEKPQRVKEIKLTDENQQLYTFTIIPHSDTSELLYINGSTLYTGIEKVAEYDKLFIWPNPASDFIQIRLPEHYGSQSVITIHDLSGRIILSKIVPSGTESFRLELSNIHPGLYQISVSGSRYFAKATLIKLR